MRPPKPPTGGQAVTAQLIVVSIWAAGKGTMAASVLACPLQLWWQSACWLTHFNYDGSQRAGLPTSHLPAPQLLRALKLYYAVASSQLPAPQIAPRTTVVLQSHQFWASSSPPTPRTTVVLQSRQCSSPSSPDTPRPQVVLPTRQFSSSRSPATPRTKVVLHSREFSPTTHSSVLIFPLPSYSAY